MALLRVIVVPLIVTAIGIALGLLTRPGRNSSVDAAAAAAPKTTGSWWDFLLGLVPANVLGLQASAAGGSHSLSFNVLQLIVIAAAIGIAALEVGEAAEPFLSCTRSVLQIVQKALWWVILLAPIDALGLIGNAVASHGWGSLGSLGVTRAVVMLTLTPSALGLPLAGVGLLLAIDPILDMGRTATNVAGQALVPTIVAEREGILDLERYRSTSTIDALEQVEDSDTDLLRREPASA